MKSSRWRRRFLWGTSALLYLVFVFWYTSFGGPMSTQEISEALLLMEQRELSPQAVERLEKFMRTDSGRQFVMVNILDMAENPPDVEGVGGTAEEFMGRYMEHMYPQLLRRASHPLFFGQAVSDALDILGMGNPGVENAGEENIGAGHVGIRNPETWDQGALVRYRSRRDFMQIVLHPDMGSRHSFKLAALDKTIAYPVEVVLTTGEPRFVLALLLLAITALMDILLFSVPGVRRSGASRIGV